MKTQADSTSCVQRVPSNRPEDVIQLGRRIVEELELRSGVDTLAKWMAHYIAELIHQSEIEQDPAKRQALEDKCCSVIQELWKGRSRMPLGVQPLGHLHEVLAAFLAMRAEHDQFSAMVNSHKAGISNPWLTFCCNAYCGDLKLSRIALLAALLEHDLGRERRWVAENGAAVSADEERLIEALNGWTAEHVGLLRSADDPALSSLVPPEREKRLLEELESTLKLQNQALAQLKQTIEKRGVASEQSKD